MEATNQAIPGRAHKGRKGKAAGAGEEEIKFLKGGKTSEESE